jgi:hypothetical protein
MSALVAICFCVGLAFLLFTVLHMAFGDPANGRTFMALFGLTVLAFAVTGLALGVWVVRDANALPTLPRMP